MVTHIMSDAIEAAAEALCRATGLDWDMIPDAAEGDNEDTGPETRRYFRQWVRPAITAYEAAKGVGVPYLWVYESPGYFNPATGGEPPYTDFSDVEKPGYFPLYRALTSPASGERDAVVEVTDAMVEAALVYWCSKLPRKQREQPIPGKLREHMRASLAAALRMEGK